MICFYDLILCKTYQIRIKNIWTLMNLSLQVYPIHGNVMETMIVEMVQTKVWSIVIIVSVTHKLSSSVIMVCFVIRHCLRALIINFSQI